jgi:hypothetical protein
MSEKILSRLFKLDVGTFFMTHIKAIKAKPMGMPFQHRNLRSRTCMFELLLQKFWAKKNLVKSLLISTLDKIIYYIKTFLEGSTKPLFTTQNRVETS